jgi:hypothetical protein
MGSCKNESLKKASIGLQVQSSCGSFAIEINPHENIYFGTWFLA